MTGAPDRAGGRDRPRGPQGSRGASANRDRPRRGKNAVDPARAAAYALLRDVHEGGAYANLRLPALLRERGLSGRDAALATELAYGTLRWRGLYDAILAACVDRGLDAVDPELLDVLRLGAHQLLKTRIPPHAAVAATVDLARSVGGDGRSRFANAVLRRVSEREVDEWVSRVAPSYESDPVGHLAIAQSHPRWIVSALRDSLGAPGSAADPGGASGDLLAELTAALAANNEAPAVMLAARPGRIARDELVAAGATPAAYAATAAQLAHGDPGAIAAVRDGRAHVQDEGSQLVALALAAADLGGPDRTWFDLAAGPGGKAALLAGLAAERGARLLAAEIRPHRARLVAGALAGWTDVLTVVADARTPAWRDGAADRVLLDAPCTGLGALRRRADARWRHQPGDLPPLTRLQEELLDAAIAAARPGGLVAYVTCSPHLAETRQLTARVLARRSDINRVEAVDARPYLPGVPMLGPGPDVQLWPHRHGTDAMYLALFRRL